MIRKILYFFIILYHSSVISKEIKLVCFWSDEDLTVKYNGNIAGDYHKEAFSKFYKNPKIMYWDTSINWLWNKSTEDIYDKIEDWKVENFYTYSGGEKNINSTSYFLVKNHELNKEYKAKGIPRELEYKYEILYNIESHELFYVREINRKFQHYSQNIRTEIAAKCTPN